MVFYPSFSAKFGVCRSKMVDMSTFVLVWLYTLLVLLYFVGIVPTKFHAKSGVCSSRNEWVMQNLESVSKKWLIYEYFCTCFYSLHYFVWIVHTKFHTKSGVFSSRNGWVMQHLESVGQKWLIYEYFCTCLYFLHFLYCCTFIG